MSAELSYLPVVFRGRSVSDLEDDRAIKMNFRGWVPRRAQSLGLWECCIPGCSFFGQSSHFGVPHTLPCRLGQQSHVPIIGKKFPVNLVLFFLPRISNSNRTNISSPQPLHSRPQPLRRHPRSSRTAPRPTGLRGAPGLGLGALGRGCSTARTPALTRCLPTRNRGSALQAQTQAGLSCRQIIRYSLPRVLSLFMFIHFMKSILLELSSTQL